MSIRTQKADAIIVYRNSYDNREVYCSGDIVSVLYKTSDTRESLERVDGRIVGTDVGTMGEPTLRLDTSYRYQTRQQEIPIDLIEDIQEVKR